MSKNKGTFWFPYFSYVLMITFIWYIGEAISMCDKVIVLTDRPAKIKNIYDIELDNKDTPINNRKDPKFNYYYDLIWKDIDYHE